EYADASTVTQSGGITFTGGGTLLKTGAGKLVFGGGGSSIIHWQLAQGALIDVEAGTLVGGNNLQDVWTSKESDLNIAPGATFNGSEANVRVAALTGINQASVLPTLLTGSAGNGYVTFTVGVDDRDGSFAGVIADSDSTDVGNLTKVGLGTLTLS